MAGDHKCPVCGSTFTRSQHVARHMRSHTGDRPYKCTHCGDQFARSDLLSRHVNKCHSADKLKAGATAGRRKGRQASNGNGPQPTTEEQTPAVAMGYRHPQPNIVGSLSDPFSNPASHYPNYRSAPYNGRPSFDSSHPSSFPSSAAASVDNLHAQPASTYSAVANSNYARASDPFAYRTYPSYSVPQTQPNLFPSSYKESSAVQVQSASDPFVGYDLPTPLAYPHGKERTSSHSSSIHSYNIQSSVDHPQLQQDASYYQQHQPAVRYGSDPQTNGLPSVDGGQQQYVPAPNAENGLGEGGFSSAFGLMSLDDPNVIAGVHDGVPFFDNNNTPQQPPDLHALLQQAAPQSSEAIDWNALVEPPGLSPAAREREANALREIWSAFLRDPTTGLKADGTEKGKPNFPTPSLHRRSSSYSGQVRDASNALPSIAYKSSSNSDGQRTNASGVVAHLEAQAARDHANYPQQPQRRASQNAMNVPHVGTMHNPDALRSYEEAILSRKAPVLKMPPKIRSRDSAPNGSGVPSGSSVLPSISSTSRPTLPGGVGSLAGSASSMPVSAAAASAVPVGAIMNQGLAALQQQPQRHERPVVPMPKPRSRPSTSSGYHNETSPTSAVSSGRATPAHRSEPPSRPRTSAGSNDNTTGVVSASGDSSRPSTANSSPPSTHPTQPNTQSQTIPTSTNLSGVAPAAESRPGTANPSPPQSSSYAMAHLQPSNNTFAPYIQYSGNMGPPMGPVVYSQPQPTYAYIPQSQNVQHDDLSQGVVSRPTYKRLASQILEPAVTKRQNVRRGSNAHENPIDDDDEEEADHVQHDRVSTSRSTSGSSGAPLGPSASSSYQSESPMTAYRRMSEPSSLATRMYPRPTQVAVGPAVRELNQ